ncbi:MULTISPECIES: glyoxalase [Mangrovimonas]|uniref:Glyoxalase n=2 Tax=Mangrovimonas TaxID=1211036 RepID=A0A428JWN7_9FLAO|nr:glyoxalase [Mangrovimonas spongiae]RSK38607.1 glyoxalase [Mangrovimonas spongiae]
MNNRNQDLLQCRPQISSIVFPENMSNDERFQNKTLRPIIKLQNDLFVEVFRNYANKHKNVFYDLSNEKQIDYIENAIHKDMKFRNSLKGMVIGLFTVDEYKFYITNSSALNKRMMNLVKERLIDNLMMLQKHHVLQAI